MLHPIDRPQLVDAIVVVLVALHAVLTGFERMPNFWADFYIAARAEQVALHLGVVGAAAIVAGFAGVVVVFGLQSSGDRFSRFRLVAGESLRRNWTASISAGLVAAGLGLVAAVSAYVPWLILAGPWLLEAALLLTLHAGIRLVYLLHLLSGVVREEDIARHKAQRTRGRDDVPWKPNA